MRLSYLVAQLAHTMGKASKDSSFRIRPAIDILQRIGHLPPRATVLSLGCRNRIEPDLLEQAGWRVTAVDLFPMARGIRRADMHGLPFQDRTFDAVVASHCLEHSYDPGRAVSEVWRVLRGGGCGWIACPVNFRPSAHDLQDFGSIGGLLRHVPGTYIIEWSRTAATEIAVLVRKSDA